MRTICGVLATALLGCGDGPAYTGPLAGKATPARGYLDPSLCTELPSVPDEPGERLRACQGRLADSVVTIGVSTSGRVLWVSKSWPVPSTRVTTVHDSVARVLTARFGESRVCLSDDGPERGLAWQGKDFATVLWTRVEGHVSRLDVSEKLGSADCIWPRAT